MSDSNTTGVQDLIDQLKSEGVQEGQQQAEALLGETKKQAASIVEGARREAEQIIQNAQQEAERLEANGKKALALASRDTSLRLKEQLEHEFRGFVGKLVQGQFAASDYLASLIQELAGKAVAQAGGDGSDSGNQDGGGVKLEFDVGGDPEQLTAFVNELASKMVGEGFELRADASLSHGFRVRSEGENVEINFSDEAVTAALMRFLAPKFRQVIGSVDEGS